jgi:hypothetical protein
MEVSGRLHAQAVLHRYSLLRVWVGPRAVLDAVEKRKVLVPAWTRTQVFQPITSHFTD